MRLRSAIAVETPGCVVTTTRTVGMEPRATAKHQRQPRTGAHFEAAGDDRRQASTGEVRIAVVGCEIGQHPASPALEEATW
jgi:hypothetical protein